MKHSSVNHKGKSIWIRIRNSPKNVIEISRSRKRRWLSSGSLAELDTQLIIAEMQGYAPYAHEMKSRIIGLMAAIRKFAAALRK